MKFKRYCRKIDAKYLENMKKIDEKNIVLDKKMSTKNKIFFRSFGIKFAPEKFYDAFATIVFSLQILKNISISLNHSNSTHFNFYATVISHD
jgi:hypothetical protein